MTTGRRADRGRAANVPPPRRSRDARQILPCRALTPGVAILGGQAGLRAAGAPWWTVCFLGTLGLVAACLGIVFPQDSPDKAAWWSERRRTHRRRQGHQCRAAECGSGDDPWAAKRPAWAEALPAERERWAGHERQYPYAERSRPTVGPDG